MVTKTTTKAATKTAKKIAPRATKPVAKRVTKFARVVKAAKVSKPAKPAKADTNPITANARKMYLAGLGAATRVQDEAVKVYGLIANEAQRLTEMTNEAAETLAKKAGMYVGEGKKIQSKAAAVAEAKARDAAKEVKTFVKKSEKTLKQNIERTIGATVANAKQGVTQLEQVFETRVAKTLNTFGIPSSQNVRELQARMVDLQKALAQLNKRGVRA
jgi:Poly(hydroxyalcanoate) granule associated protein (phasin)